MVQMRGLEKDDLLPRQGLVVRGLLSWESSGRKKNDALAALGGAELRAWSRRDSGDGHGKKALEVDRAGKAVVCGGEGLQ
jgi:hypothetical protein